MVASSEGAIWERLIEPEKTDLTPEAARYFLRLAFRPADVQRMNELAAKARGGALSAEDEADLENYRHVSHVLALMQSKARLALRTLGFAA